MPLNKTEQKGTKTKKGTNQSATKNIERRQSASNKKNYKTRERSPTFLGYHSYVTGTEFKMADTETNDDFSSTSLNDPDDVDNRFVS